MKNTGACFWFEPTLFNYGIFRSKEPSVKIVLKSWQSPLMLGSIEGL